MVEGQLLCTAGAVSSVTEFGEVDERSYDYLSRWLQGLDDRDKYPRLYFPSLYSAKLGIRKAYLQSIPPNSFTNLRYSIS